MICCNTVTIFYQSVNVVFAAGRYIVKVLYAEVDVGGSPAHPEIFDSSLVRIGQISDGILGQPVRFEGALLTCCCSPLFSRNLG